MKLHMTRVNPSAHLPVYGSEHAACMDFSVPPGNSYTILPGERALIGTGWAVAVPDGYCLQLYSRSGHGAKLNVKLANSVGIIDSDYRGEVMACVYNAGDKSALFLPGDRFVQAMLVATPRIEMDVVSELPVSTRGAGGFGSTGSGFSISHSSGGGGGGAGITHSSAVGLGSGNDLGWVPDLQIRNIPAEEVTINTDNAGVLPVRAVRPQLRQTHTLVTMPVSKSAYDEIRAYFAEAGYDHVIGNEDGEGEFLEMTGIAITIKRA